MKAGFRPEHVSVGETGVEGGVIASVEPLGASTVVVATCGPVTVKALVAGQPRYAIGEAIAILPGPGCVAFFRSASGERLSMASPNKYNA